MGLDLNDNKIGDSGAEAIGRALLQNVDCRLRWLYLNINYIGDRGAEAILLGLSNENSNLGYLDLRNNQIGDKGIALLEEINLDGLVIIRGLDEQNVSEGQSFEPSSFDDKIIPADESDYEEEEIPYVTDDDIEMRMAQ